MTSYRCSPEPITFGVPTLLAQRIVGAVMVAIEPTAAVPTNRRRETFSDKLVTSFPSLNPGLDSQCSTDRNLAGQRLGWRLG